MRHVILYLSRRGSKTHSVAAPVGRVREIIEEYRLLDWNVYW